MKIDVLRVSFQTFWIFSKFPLRFTVYFQLRTFDEDLERKREGFTSLPGFEWRFERRFLRRTSRSFLIFLVSVWNLRNRKQNGEPSSLSLPVQFLFFFTDRILLRSLFFSLLRLCDRLSLSLLWWIQAWIAEIWIRWWWFLKKSLRINTNLLSFCSIDTVRVYVFLSFWRIGEKRLRFDLWKRERESWIVFVMIWHVVIHSVTAHWWVGYL